MGNKTNRKKNSGIELFILRLMKVFDPVLVAALFGITWFEFYAQTMYLEPFYRRGNYALILLYLVIYAYLAHIYDGFNVSTSKKNEIILSQTLSLLLTNALAYLIIFMLARHIPNPIPLLIMFAAQIIISILWTLVVSKWYFSAFQRKKTTIIFDERLGLDVLIEKYGLTAEFEIIKTIHCKDVLGSFKTLDDSEVVFFSGVHSHERNAILKYCITNNITCYIIPRIGDVLMHGARKIHMLRVPMLMVQRYNPNIEYALLKRLMDIVISLICIIVFSPIMLIISIAIKAHDGGPVIYSQTRATKDGKLFKMLKFRSMIVNAESDGVARLSTGETDNRITPVGKIIRRYRLDELPQVFNVLVGHMSIIGPRPERPEIIQEYVKTIPEYSLRLQSKAGMTGYAQLYGKYNSTPYDKLQLDLFYTINPSLIEDFRIIIATIKILFIKDSTDGIEDGQTNALK